MEWFLVGVVFGLALAVAISRWRSRSSSADFAETDDDAIADEPTPEPMGPQAFDRNFLATRNRVLDTSKWDNSPGGSAPAEAAPEDLPRFFDRDYLNKRGRPEA